MKKVFFAALAAMLCLTTSAALTQEVLPPAMAGVYRGHLAEVKGSRQSDFDLDLTMEPGTLLVYQAAPQCKNASVGIFQIEGDSVQLETIGVPRGCERSFALKLSDSGKRLTGTMRYESSDWNVRAERRWQPLTSHPRPRAGIAAWNVA